MTYKEIATMINGTGLTNAYYSFPENSNPVLPYILFYYPNSADLIADNINYQPIEKLNIELYTENKDFETEAIVEKMLNDNGLAFARSESYLNNEHMYEVLFETSVVITEEPITEGVIPNNG